MKQSNVFQNTAMLYVMSIAKLIFPMLTLPYLTRVLSENSYGFVSYVRSCMTYIQLVVDFGFILSSVKDIVKAEGNLEKIGYITGNTFISKLLLSALSLIVLLFMCISIEILQINIFFVVLNFIAIALTSFFADFLFRGIERMHYITVIYLISKGVSVVLTFALVKNDKDILLIPILDITTNLISIFLTYFIIKRLGIRVRVSCIKDCFTMLRDSFTYFLSSVASTAFAALNTVLIGIFIKDLTQVAYWSLCLNVINAIQGLYAPITNSVYPFMIKVKNLAFIHKVLLILMPFISAGCIICFAFADFAMLIVGGSKYLNAATLFRYLVPILFFSFPAQLYGWPTLGAIGMVRETTASTVVVATIQVLGIFFLVLINGFTLIHLAILRTVTEVCLLIMRMFITYRHKNAFA